MTYVPPIPELMPDARHLLFSTVPEPDFLYHYTDAQALLSIFANKQIWLSHCDYMNDTREFLHGKEMLLSRIRRYKMNSTSVELNGYLNKLEEALTPISQPYFLFSLSSNGDQLSQWRAYTGSDGGYSIGFKYNWLKRLLDGTHYIMAPVVYDGEKQRQFSDHLLERCIEEFFIEPSNSNFDRVFCLLFENLCLACYFFKHNAFEEEAEWRLVLPYHKAEDFEHWKLRRRGAYLIPYVVLAFGDFVDREHSTNPDDIIFKLVAGPGLHDLRATGGLSILVRNCFIPRSSIGVSRAPYRTD